MSSRQEVNFTFELLSGTTIHPVLNVTINMGDGSPPLTTRLNFEGTGPSWPVVVSYTYPNYGLYDATVTLSNLAFPPNVSSHLVYVCKYTYIAVLVCGVLRIACIHRWTIGWFVGFWIFTSWKYLKSYKKWVPISDSVHAW